MLLLNNLNERGYNQLKKDRDILIKEIEQLNSILSQFDLAYPYLSSIYDPKVAPIVVKIMLVINGQKARATKAVTNQIFKD